MSVKTTSLLIDMLWHRVKDASFMDAYHDGRDQMLESRKDGPAEYVLFVLSGGETVLPYPEVPNV